MRALDMPWYVRLAAINLWWSMNLIAWRSFDSWTYDHEHYTLTDPTGNTHSLIPYAQGAK